MQYDVVRMMSLFRTLIKHEVLPRWSLTLLKHVPMHRSTVCAISLQTSSWKTHMTLSVLTCQLLLRQPRLCYSRVLVIVLLLNVHCCSRCVSSCCSSQVHPFASVLLAQLHTSSVRSTRCRCLVCCSPVAGAIVHKR
jgi:hypothetical protein